MITENPGRGKSVPLRRAAMREYRLRLRERERAFFQPHEVEEVFELEADVHVLHGAGPGTLFDAAAPGAFQLHRRKVQESPNARTYHSFEYTERACVGYGDYSDPDIQLLHDPIEIVHGMNRRVRENPLPGRVRVECGDDFEPLLLKLPVLEKSAAYATTANEDYRTRLGLSEHVAQATDYRIHVVASPLVSADAHQGKVLAHYCGGYADGVSKIVREDVDYTDRLQFLGYAQVSSESQYGRVVIPTFILTLHSRVPSNCLQFLSYFSQYFNCPHIF